jgi:hypothetical protein
MWWDRGRYYTRRGAGFRKVLKHPVTPQNILAAIEVILR